VERSFSVNHSRAKLAAAALLLLLRTAPVTADHELVLVASTHSPIDSLSAIEVRKIYFGITVRHGSLALRGLRNMAGPRIDSIFLQSVVSMSQQAYERRLISGSLRYGRPRPAEFSSYDALIEELEHSPGAVTYMWREDADRLPQVKVLEILWHAY
jgi:hypothetical protein